MQGVVRVAVAGSANGSHATRRPHLFPRVTQALDEYDRLGREAFLSKYGVGKAREYFLRRGETLCESKTIVSAARGFRFPERGPLGAADFSGSERTVQVKLESLGFSVLRVNDVVRSATTSDTVPELDRAFLDRLLEVYRSAKEIGYNATWLLAMLSDQGGLSTARTLINATTVSDGYTALWERATGSDG